MELDDHDQVVVTNAAQLEKAPHHFSPRSSTWARPARAATEGVDGWIVQCVRGRGLLR